MSIDGSNKLVHRSVVQKKCVLSALILKLKLKAKNIQYVFWWIFVMLCGWKNCFRIKSHDGYCTCNLNKYLLFGYRLKLKLTNLSENKIVWKDRHLEGFVNFHYPVCLIHRRSVKFSVHFQLNNFLTTI